MKSTRGWAIIGTWPSGRTFFYYGSWRLRSEAIKAHTEMAGRSWDYCKKKGDRAVPVVITEDGKRAQAGSAKR